VLGVIFGIIFIIVGFVGGGFARKMGESATAMIIMGILMGVISCVSGFLIAETMVVLADIGDTTRVMPLS
jgi:hypothetical protein